MGSKKIYRNASLEAKRQRELRAQKADLRLKDRRYAERRALVQRGAKLLASLPKANRRYGDALLVALEKSKLMDNAHADKAKAIISLARMHERWVRKPERWEPKTHNAGRQFADLLRFVLAKWPVPAWLDGCWLANDGRGDKVQRKWWTLIAGGSNLRYAAGLPFPMSKKLAHAVLNARASSVVEAFRVGQVTYLGASPRMRRALMGSSIGRGFGLSVREAFYEEVIRFFVNAERSGEAGGLFDFDQVGPIIDYVLAQKFGVGGAAPVRPGLSMKKRTLEGLVRQVDAWHRELRVARMPVNRQWRAADIADHEFVEGVGDNRIIVRFVQLTSGLELIAEGRAMSHCVGSYTEVCANGRMAVFTMAVDTERRATIAVDVIGRKVVEARLRANRSLNSTDVRRVRAWMAKAQLTASSWALPAG